MIALPGWLGGGGSQRRKRDPTWAELLSALRQGPLAQSDTVSAAQLKGVLGLSETAAARLVAEVGATDPDDNYYGFNLPGSAPLPPQVAAQLARLQGALTRSGVLLSRRNTRALSVGAPDRWQSRMYDGPTDSGDGSSEDGAGAEGGGHSGPGAAASSGDTAAALALLSSSVATLSRQVADMAAAHRAVSGPSGAAGARIV
jgi:hypothetical protein